MIYVVGDGEFILRSDWREFVRAPEAPANYKDPDKIREYIDKRMQSIEADIIANTISLLFVDNQRFAISASPKGDTIEEKLWNLLWEDEITFFGSKAILYSMVDEATPNDSVFVKDIRKALFTRKINFTTLEEMRFPANDRKYLLIDKLMPKRDVGESYLNYAVRVLNLWGVTEDSSWSFC